MVVDAYYIFVVIIVAAIAEGFGNGELVADAHIHQTVHGIIVQKFDDGFFQNVKIGHGLIQGIACVKDLPGDHIGKMGDPFGFLEIGGIPEQLYPAGLQFLGIHKTSSLPS